ncbi:hypothetical protein JEQ12_019351 [Ovis aries]|uniref:Uncharacterized protein n=1 Tax=Ovis aries TaxID=9940 RepID=A0A836A9L6_SHEEP|nr:hypothetical protein JEQ12_019351 [Ovis aries]
MTPGAAEAAERTRLRAPLRALRRLSRVPLHETARSKTVSPDYLRILSCEEYSRSDEDARMFHHFFISVGRMGSELPDQGLNQHPGIGRRSLNH